MGSVQYTVGYIYILGVDSVDPSPKAVDWITDQYNAQVELTLVIAPLITSTLLSSQTMSSSPKVSPDLPGMSLVGAHH